MADPKTVSNLPVDVSVRWTEDQKLLEQSRPYLTESMGISQHARKDVSSPAAFPEMDLLLGTLRVRPTWANFQVPPRYNEQRRRLFTSQIAPFIGTVEQQDLQIQRVEAYSSDKGGEEKEKEKETVLKLLKQVHSLNKDLVEIISRCCQYQKG